VVIIHRAYRHKVVFSKEQDSRARSYAGMARLIYNETLAYKRMVYRETGRFTSIYALKKELKSIKKTPGLEFFADAPHHVLCEAMLDLHAAFQRFFRGESGYPAFKKRGSGDSFRFPDKKQIKTHHPDREGWIGVPKLGWVRLINSYPRLGTRLYEGELRSVTFTREADGWYASIHAIVEVDNPETPQGPPIGVDRGVRSSYALSTGVLEQLPVESRRVSRRYARLQQKLAQQQRGSKNAAKTKRKMGRLRKRVRDRRNDAIHKTTTHLAKKHSLIAIEKLNTKNMMRSASGTIEKPGKNVAQKRGLNRSIAQQAWFEFERQLTYKTQWYGSHLVAVDPAYTSQTCAACGHIAAENRTGEAFACTACGHEAHADLNAALNILNRGLPGTDGTSETETIVSMPPEKRKRASRDARRKLTT